MGAVIATGEYELLTESAAIVDRSERGKLLVRGGEAAEFLQGQITNDVEALTPGSGCYAALLTHKGKLRADMRVLRGEDWIWLDTEPAALAALEHTVGTYGIGRDVRAKDVTAGRAILSVIGPSAGERIDGSPPAQEHSFVEGEHGLYVTTDLGVDVICESGAAASVTEALGLETATEAAAECLRVEAGRPRLGRDMGEDTIPEEAGINERAVSFTKGCYVGQETVARLHYRGKPNRRLRGLRLSRPVETGAEVVLGERPLGTVGSACESPRSGPIALAVLRREAGAGDSVAVGEDRIEAEVVDLPFTDP